MVKVDNFLYILPSSGPRPAGEHRYYTSSVAPGGAHKISTDIRPMLPPFYREGKISQILAQISTTIVFGPPYFGKAALYRKFKTNSSRPNDRPTTTPNLGWAGPPNSQNHLSNGCPKRVKVENFKYILRSSSPRQVQRRQCHTNCCGRSCCKGAPVGGGVTRQTGRPQVAMPRNCHVF